uniref:Radical SAM domain-containing protein n=1 Tax=uncultured marine thaumarchaeote AD1000_01_F04 TaxID=1455879 RepID=A0A075FL18_9ARCH|nr:radical SAM domain-containing protein [uncultured marine thaumarchaeote AD1000_01_F04]
MGCPFACGFCGGREAPSLRRIRTRSSESIIAEVMHLHTTYGYTGFMFYDDELNVNPKLVELMNGLAEAQQRHNIDFRLRGFVKSELFTDEQAKAMYRAGFRWILVGFESGAPRILTNINKKATLEDNTRCVEIARRNGLKVKALMSIGHPGESAETVLATQNWLLQVKPDDFDVTIITTYPGTPYFDRAVKDSQRAGVWAYTFEKTADRLYTYDVDYTTTADYYKGDPEGGYKAFVFTDYLSADDLVRLRDQVERTVRAQLNIPFNPGAPGIRYEHSMGQHGLLPSKFLRSTNWRDRDDATAIKARELEDLQQKLLEIDTLINSGRGQPERAMELAQELRMMCSGAQSESLHEMASLLAETIEQRADVIDLVQQIKALEACILGSNETDDEQHIEEAVLADASSATDPE